LEPANRDFFWFNDKLYFWVLRPAARAYSKVAPKPVRSSVQRFFANIRYPPRFVNNVLQGKFDPAAQETARFVVNSTLGIAGFLDPADDMKLKQQPADFDQTLGVYGIRPGPYFDWPILGPSSVRGSLGMVVDTLLTPGTYLDTEISIPVHSYEFLNATSLHPGEYEDFKKAALDPYVALRSAYYDNREDFVRKARVAPVSGGSK
jgi:phospholipid-binding lipoprotein MlaA